MSCATPMHEELQALVGRALIDPSFRRDLLNGHRAECLNEFELTREEHSVASTIQAGDLSSFARQLDGWINDRAVRSDVTASLASSRNGPVLSAVA